MSRLDVRDLKHETLPLGQFPGDVPADFRLYLVPQAHKGMVDHAKKNVAVEICGVLVGKWQADSHGPYAVVTDYISCDNAASKFAEVTFTHESWSQINREMDTRFADKRIIGWYHSHPDFGIFLSDRDCFIHEHFFSGSGQVAYVIDPVRELEGVFAWRNNKPELLPHFWIGDTIRTAEASRLRSSAPLAEHERGTKSKGGEQSSNATLKASPRGSEPTYWGPLTTLLAGLCIFLLGYLYAGMKTNWERQMIAEGVVANFADLKVLHQGLEANLATVRQRIEIIADELRKMPETTQDLPAEETPALANKRKQLLDHLDLLARDVGMLEKEYGLSAEQRAALTRWLAERKAALRQPPQAAEKKDSTPTSEDRGGKEEIGATAQVPRQTKPTPDSPPTSSSVAPATPNPIPEAK